jgi:hypothetical protein
MAFQEKLRFSNGGYMDMSLYFDEISDEFKDAVVKELTPVIDKMVAMAKQNVSVGTISRPVAGTRQRGNKVSKYKGKSWTSRTPGRLKASIRSAVHRRHDKTAVIGFFEAGSHDAYYALMHEYKNPYFMTAFNKHRAAAMAAVELALSKVCK